MARGQFFDPALASDVLACATLKGDKFACAQYGVAQISITRWRRRMQTDRSLLNQVTLKISEQRPAWHLELPQALSDFIAYLGRAMKLRHIEPDTLRAIGEQFERMARIQIAMRIVNERFAAGPGREGLEEVGSLPAGRRIDPPDADPEPSDSE